MTAAGVLVDWAALGAAIRERRTEVGMDCGRLAEFAGLVGYRHAARIEHGTVVCSDRTLALIADALHTTPALLRDRAWRIYTDALSHTTRGDAGQPIPDTEIDEWLEDADDYVTTLNQGAPSENYRALARFIGAAASIIRQQQAGDPQ